MQSPLPLLPPSDSVSVQDEADPVGALGLGLRRRLLAMLVLPLCVLACVNMAFDYRIAGGAAVQQDANLQRLAPLLVDSLVSWREEGSDRPEPVVLMAPPIEDFLKDRNNLSGYRLSDLQGRTLAGDEWIDPVIPGTSDPEFNSVQVAGVTFRIVSLRASSRVGEVIAQVADGSDPRQQWWRAFVFKVLVPNLILVIAAFFVVRSSVARALAPLIALTRDVQHRSPADLQPIDPQLSPLEVRPLVESLNRLLGTVNTLVQSQRRFVADAAHQLRTPLTGLQSQVEAWAQSGDQLADGKGAITVPTQEIYKLRDATRRTTQLANQLLALSRVDAQFGHAQPTTWVDLQALCEDALHLHLDAATSKGVDLGLEVQSAHTQGHEWLLKEALSNMVDNAVKYTPSGQSITIRCGGTCVGAQTAVRVWLEVEDAGVGIAEGEKDKVFQRFYRSPGANGVGNGLGLAIVNEIVQLHNAQIILEQGALGQGLRMRIEFAVRESAT